MPNPARDAISDSLRITQSQWERLLCDPVMAAEIFFGIRLDAFQAARLRYYWWVQNVIDSSGFSSGKTICVWLFCNLRALLIPDHHVGVYFPTFETGKNTFWLYYSTIRSPLFRAAMGRTEERADGDGTSLGAACYKAYFKNGNILFMPAPSFMKAAATQASMRFNTLVVEEWTHVDASSTGIDEQLIGRCTKACWNQNHPVWGNHILYSAPAKTRLHPAYSRFRKHQRRIEAGDPTYANLHYSYKDYSQRPVEAPDKSGAAASGRSRTFAELYRIESTIENKRNAARSRADWLGEGLGLWTASGKGWYTEDSLCAAMANGTAQRILPCLSRAEWEHAHPDKAPVFFFGGVDPAPSETMRSDDGAIVIGAAWPRPSGISPEGILSPHKADWNLAPIYARRLTAREKAGTRQWSGLLHGLHHRYRFERIGVDPNGGGVLIGREMMAPRQIINGIECDAMPICDLKDGPKLVVIGQFILLYMRRGDPGIESLWPDLSGDDLLNDGLYSEFKDSLDHQIILLPPSQRELRAEAEFRAAQETWPEERTLALVSLNYLVEQAAGIAVAVKDDETYAVTKRGARQFSATGKKDLVSATLYMHAAFLAWLRAVGDEEPINPEDEVAMTW